jgi:hypothetical protein
MRFSLTYDGELRSNGDPRQKWDIRKHLHPQLEELWRIDPSLLRVLDGRHIPAGGYFQTEMHHSQPPGRKIDADISAIDLCAPVIRAGKDFFPLVRESFLLKCSLKILFLRKEDPGRVYQGGDLDNRLKTLFDALAVPTTEQVVTDPEIAGPIYTLLEDDALITKVDVETHRLLSRPGASQHEVRCVIEVDVRVTQPRLYNHAFLGG